MRKLYIPYFILMAGKHSDSRGWKRSAITAVVDQQRMWAVCETEMVKTFVNLVILGLLKKSNEPMSGDHGCRRNNF